LLSLIPFILLLSQVVLLYIQNKKIESQNQKIEQQVYLEEASRRNNLVLLMDNILEKVNTEIDATNKTLSQPLIGRISALAQGFQPYKFLEDDTLTKSFSPERGQFLLALANSGIDTPTMDIIYTKTIFKQAYLKNADMDMLYLKNIDLEEANLNNANLKETDLSEANLIVAKLGSSKLEQSNMARANLLGANLGGANLTKADLRQAYLGKTNLSFAILKEADLLFTDLSAENLQGADLSCTDLSRADLSYTNLREVDLKETEGLTYEKLFVTRSLYQTKGIPKEIKDSLLAQKPELFEEPKEFKFW